MLGAVPADRVIGPEALAARTGLSLTTVLRRLSLLELAGLIQRRDGTVALMPQTDG